MPNYGYSELSYWEQFARGVESFSHPGLVSGRRVAAAAVLGCLVAGEALVGTIALVSGNAPVAAVALTALVITAGALAHTIHEAGAPPQH